MTADTFFRQYAPDHMSRQPLRYYLTRDEKSWLLLSVGPDNTLDITPEEFSRLSEHDDWVERLRRSPLTWDPTNGTLSSGDIWLSNRDIK